MFENVSTTSDRIILIAVGGLVMMIWFSGLLWWVLRRDIKTRQLRRRIGLLDKKNKTEPTKVLSLWREDGEHATTVVPHTQWTSRIRKRIERIPQDIGWDISVYLLFGTVAAMIGILFTATLMFTQSMLSALGMAIMAFLGLVFFFKHISTKRHALFERQFEDALTLIARSLRAGQPLLGSFQLVAEEMEPPVRTIFHDICQQQALGLSLEESIRRVANSYEDKDLNLFATSVVIQLRTGGNLADMMNRLAHVMRDRLKLLRRVRVLTAQTEYSKRVLLVLPLVMLVVLTGMNPDYMDPMFETAAGRYLGATAIFMMIAGAVVMNRMARAEY